MSANPTLITKKHFEYIASHTLTEDPFLQELKISAKQEGIPAQWISHSQSVFMQILLRSCAARHVIEVGTLAGYSAIQMARALPENGCVRSIELLDKHADFAQNWVDKSDVRGKIEIHRGPGADVLKGFETHSADAAFVDADKTNYPVYLEESLRIVRSGGLIMVDNAFAFGQLFDENPTDREVSAVKAFNNLMAATTKVQSIIAPFGDGLWVGVKL